MFIRTPHKRGFNEVSPRGFAVVVVLDVAAIGAVVAAALLSQLIMRNCLGSSFQAAPIYH